MVGTKTNKKITLKTGRSNGLPVFCVDSIATMRADGAFASSQRELKR